MHTTGGISILGKNIYDPDVSLAELRKTVGMVFQRPNPLPISIYENVLFGLRVHTRRDALSRGQRDALVTAALEDVFLWNDVKDKLHTKATLLTLEQQQKLCIARLLPLKPRVILMDEPCSALDAEGTQAIESLIETLKERYTIVIVTHNMGQAARASEECIYMLLGRVVEHGKTKDIFLHPQQKETEMYIEGRYGSAASTDFARCVATTSMVPRGIMRFVPARPEANRSSHRGPIDRWRAAGSPPRDQRFAGSQGLGAILPRKPMMEALGRPAEK